MTKQRHNPFQAGFAFARRRIRWDSRLLIVLFIVLAAVIAFGCLFAWDPTGPSPSSFRADFFDSCETSAKSWKESYESEGNIQALWISRYYDAISSRKLYPYQYYIFGGEGRHGEIDITISKTTARLFSMPSFLGLFAIALAWPLFLSEGARAFRRNVTLAAYSRRRFETGVLIYYESMLLFAALLYGGIAFALASPRDVLHFDGENWAFHSAYALWIRAWGFGTLNLLLFGLLYVGAFLHLPPRPSLEQASLFLGFLSMAASPVLFYFSAKPIPLRGILRETLFCGPLLLDEVTPTNLASWTTQGAAFLALGIALCYLPRKEK